MHLSDYRISRDAVGELCCDLTGALTIQPELPKKFDTLVVPGHCVLLRVIAVAGGIQCETLRRNSASSHASYSLGKQPHEMSWPAKETLH
jgi:hypothetical protein